MRKNVMVVAAWVFAAVAVLVAFDVADQALNEYTAGELFSAELFNGSLIDRILRWDFD